MWRTSFGESTGSGGVQLSPERSACQSLTASSSNCCAILLSELPHGDSQRFSASTSSSTSSQVLARGPGRCSFVEFVKTIVFCPSARSRSMFDGRIFDVEVGADGRLLLHEAQVPIRDIVPIEPLNRLAHGDLVKVFDEQPMRDDANSHAGFRQPAQRLRRPGHRRQLQEQLALHDGEFVQRLRSRPAPDRRPIRPAPTTLAPAANRAATPSHSAAIGRSPP